MREHEHQESTLQQITIRGPLTIQRQGSNIQEEIAPHIVLIK